MKNNVRIGMRLLFASLVLFISQGSAAGFVVALIGAFMPIPKISKDSLRSYMKRLATGLVEEDEKKLLEKITDQVKGLIKESQKDNVSQSTIDKLIKGLNDEVEKLTDEQKKALKDRCDDLAKKNEELQASLDKTNEALNKQGLELKKMADKAPTNQPEVRKSFREIVKDSIMEFKDKILTEKNDDYGKRFSLKDYFSKSANRTTPEMTLKVAVDMLESNIVGNNVQTVRLAELDPQRVGIPLTIYPHVTQVFNSKTMNRPTMSLLVVYTYTDGSGTKTEGSAPSQSSFLFKTVEFKSFVIATYFTLSDETLDDLDEALDEISMTAPDKILDKIDSKILSTAGDDASDIAGLFTANKMTAFDSTPFLARYDSATIIDVISAAKLQCENNKYRPDIVYLSPGNVDLIAAQKNTFDDSRNDRRVTYDSLGRPFAIHGLRVVISTSMTDTTLAVIDSRQPIIGRRKDMTMEIGYNGTDFTEGQKTVMLKIRIAFGVRDKAGVIYVSDIHNAIADITVGS